MYKTTLVLVALAAVVASASAAPTKPVWPTQFNAPFGLYDKLYIPQDKNITANFYYDWGVKTQVLDYYDKCFPLISVKSGHYPCKMWFGPKGIIYSAPKLDVDCCTFFPGVGAVPPQFLEGFEFKDVEDAQDFNGNTHKSNHWVGKGSSSSFAYWTDVTTNHDVRFKDGPTGVYWQWGKFNVGPQDPSIFELPKGDCSKKCSKWFAAELGLTPANAAAMGAEAEQAMVDLIQKQITDPMVNLAKEVYA